MGNNISLSYSKISTFLECPKKYYFQYVCKLPTKPKYYYSFGETIHKVLEEMYHPEKSLEKFPRLNNILYLIDEYWIGEGFWDKDQEEEAKSEAKEIISNYYRRNIFTYKPAFSVEEHISFNIENISIAGKIDRIDRLPGGKFEIIDYKTGNIDNISNIDFISKLQLIIYSMGFKAKYDFEASIASWYFLRKNEKLSLTVTEEDYQKGKNVIRETYEEIMKSSFNKKENTFCQFCDFIEACQKDISYF